MSQCPSCGGDCGYLKNKGCQYGKKTLPDMLTPQEHQEIVRIVARWDYATEAAIEAYLLGKKLSDNVAQAYLKGFDEASSQHGCAECGIGGGHALYCVKCAEVALNTWVGLTDEETRGCVEATIEITDPLLLDAVNAVIVDVERLLREKNT